MLAYLTNTERVEDKNKFEKIYMGYKQAMYYTANRILKDSYAAEDAVHEAFVRIINILEKIDEDNCHKTRAFLLIIVENIAIDIYRKRKSENLISYDESEVYIGEELLQKESKEAGLFYAFNRLPVNYSIVLSLKYSQGYKDIEIAAILGIKEDNVRQRISRAKKKLGKLLEEDKNK